MPSHSSPAARRLASSLLLLLVACGGGAGDGRPAAGAAAGSPLPPEFEPPVDGAVIELAREPLASGTAPLTVLRTLQGDDANPIGAIVDVELLPDGRVLVLDAQARDVKLFAEDGRLERVLGRDGGGPGEIGRHASNVFHAAPDTVLVVDPMQGRVVRWTLDGTPAPTSRLAVHDGAPLGYRWRATDGRVLQAFAPTLGAANEHGRYDVSFLVRPALQRDTASMLELPTGADTTALIGLSSHDAQVLWDVGDDGRIVAAYNGDYRLRIYEADGLPRQLLQREAPVATISEADADALRRAVLETSTDVPRAEWDRALRTMRDGFRFPSRYPAIAGVLAGPNGETWVQRPATLADVQARRYEGDVLSGRSTTWDVYDGEGRYVAVVRLPNGFTLTRVAGRTLVGHGVNAGGEPVAQLLRLELP